MGVRYAFPEGYYTMDDRIEDILLNKEGQEVLYKYFEPFFNNPRFGMAKKMPVGAMCKYAEGMISDSVRIEVSERLNQIKK